MEIIQAINRDSSSTKIRIVYYFSRSVASLSPDKEII